MASILAQLSSFQKAGDEPVSIKVDSNKQATSEPTVSVKPSIADLLKISKNPEVTVKAKMAPVPEIVITPTQSVLEQLKNSFHPSNTATTKEVETVSLFGGILNVPKPQ